MKPAAPVPRRAVLGAHVPPYAALVIVREVGAQLEVSAAGLAASGTEAGAQASRELRVALGQMREAARQLQERHREVPSTAATSASGNAEAICDGIRAESVVGAGLSSAEVASRLRVSTRRVRQLCTAGVLVATLDSRGWRIAQQSVDDYLDRMEATG